MTMRATVSRDPTAESSDWGGPEKAAFVEVVGGLVPCRTWSTTKRMVDDSGKSAVVEDLRAAVPVGADIQEQDRLVIRDRLGVMQFDGPVLVEARVRKGSSGSRASHFELMLTRHK
jgi:hypothetical protein